MVTPLIILVVVLLLLVAAATGGYLFGLSKNKINTTKEQEELEAKLLQASILSQIAQRISYTLDANQIVEVMTGSIDPLVPYAAIGFMVRDDDSQNMHSKIRLREPVSAAFINSVRSNMTEAFNLLCGDACKGYTTKETVVGAGAQDTGANTVGSYFNLPVVLDNEAVAIISVASPKTGLYRAHETNILYEITGLASQAVNRLRKVIRDEQRRMDAMVTSFPNALFMVDQEERIVAINDNFYQLIGYDKNQPIRLTDILEETREFVALHTLMNQTQEEQKLIMLDAVEVGNTQQQISASPVIDNDGTNIGTVVLFQDITAQKQLEQLREQFTAMLVHELRSPLTAIRWNIEDIADRSRMTKKERQEVSSEVLSVIERLLSLVNDMLDSAKIEAGKFTINAVQNDIKTVIDDTIKTFKPNAKGKGLDLLSEIDKVPLVAFDADRMRQVLANLVSNAIKFTEAGNVTIKASTKEKTLRIEVSDTGNGVPTADQPKLFQRFQQLSQGGLKESGTGLGLVITKGIIDAHGGKIGYQSNEPHGSLFWIELPIK